MLAQTGEAVDRDGRAAEQGTVHEDRVNRFLAHPFFEEEPPKSLDRNAFRLDIAAGLSVEDGAATLTAVTAASVAAVVRRLPERPRVWIVCGGGARNPTMLLMLSDRLGVPVRTADALGWSADAMEAEAFAYLAVRSMAGLALSFPTTTGVPRPMPGGTISLCR